MSKNYNNVELALQVSSLATALTGAAMAGVDGNKVALGLMIVVSAMLTVVGIMNYIDCSDDGDDDLGVWEGMLQMVSFFLVFGAAFAAGKAGEIPSAVVQAVCGGLVLSAVSVWGVAQNQSC